MRAPMSEGSDRAPGPPVVVLGDEPSPKSRRIVEDLWGRTPSGALSLDQWRAAAGAGERLPRPPWLRTEAVDAAGVPAEWVWRSDDALATDVSATDVAATDVAATDASAADVAATDLSDVGAGRSAEGPVILVLHGGGFIVCSIGTHRVLGARVAHAVGGRSLVLGYRLAPEHPFPAAVHDAAAAYGWLLDEGVDPSRIVFFGDSAGASLCLSASLVARARGLPMPRALVLISPGIDLTFAAPSHTANAGTDPFSRIDCPDRVVEWYLAGADPTQPLASPAFADFTGLPPILVMVGPDEVLVDDARTTVDRAVVAGVDATLVMVTGAFHTWLGYAGELPEADRALAYLAEFILLKSPGTTPFTGHR